MTRLQPTPDVQSVIRSTYRIANQRAVRASHTRTLVRLMDLMAAASDPLWLKIKSVNRPPPATGITVGMSHPAFPIQNMGRPYPRNIPSHLFPTLTERRHTITTTHKLKDHLRPTNIILVYITILLRA
jgi:hypothetical protein